MEIPQNEQEKWVVAEIAAAVREAEAGDFATDEEVDVIRQQLTGERQADAT